MKKLLSGLAIGLMVFGMAGMANASLITIGHATYDGAADLSASINTPLAGTTHDYKLIYDTDLQLTWLDYTSNLDNWSNQNSWAENVGSDLDVVIDSSYNDLGLDWATEWRLTEAGASPNFGYQQTDSEMGHLYYTELGNPGGSPLYYVGDFSNLKSDFYWSGTDWINPDGAYDFSFGTGYQGSHNKVRLEYALAVRPGYVDTNPVPEPATMLLLGSGLIGLIGFRRKFKKR